MKTQQHIDAEFEANKEEYRNNNKQLIIDEIEARENGEESDESVKSLDLEMMTPGEYISLVRPMKPPKVMVLDLVKGRVKKANKDKPMKK